MWRRRHAEKCTSARTSEVDKQLSILSHGISYIHTGKFHGYFCNGCSMLNRYGSWLWRYLHSYLQAFTNSIHLQQGLFKQNNRQNIWSATAQIGFILCGCLCSTTYTHNLHYYSQTHQCYQHVGEPSALRPIIMIILVACVLCQQAPCRATEQNAFQPQLRQPILVAVWYNTTHYTQWVLNVV